MIQTMQIFISFVFSCLCAYTTCEEREPHRPSWDLLLFHLPIQWDVVLLDDLFLLALDTIQHSTAQHSTAQYMQKNEE